ncbi:MAG TPA: bifunctional precorrin-2 dehydrogenase/sirohydrochlorin ferrochelatase [Longimicrobiaceae bacterium]
MRALYPALLDLTAARILVVGGGRVALRKVEGLLAAGGRPDILAPELTPALEGLAASRGLTHRAAGFSDGSVRGYQLVVAATDRAEVNARVGAEARAAGAWVNVVDDPAASSLTVPATVREGGVLAAVSTGGSSPLLARRVRRRLEQVVTPGLGRAATRLQALRGEVRKRWPDDPQQRRSFWFSLITDEFVDAAIAGRDEEVESRIEACLWQS